MATVTRQQQLLIEMVMRQTFYTFDEAKDKLEIYDNNYIKVIKEALGISEKKEKNKTSVNQGIYKEIRGLMDEASTSLRINQERERRKQEIIEILKKRQLEEQKNKNENNLESVREVDEDDESYNN